MRLAEKGFCEDGWGTEQAAMHSLWTRALVAVARMYRPLQRNPHAPTRSLSMTMAGAGRAEKDGESLWGAASGPARSSPGLLGVSRAL